MATPDPYTHTFKFQLGDGGQFINGKIEFNEDGKVSYSFEEVSIPLKNETLSYFKQLTDLLQKIYYSNGGIKNIRFKRIDIE